MKKLFELFVFLLFSSALILPQSKKLGFEFDYAQFGYDSTSNYLEFYYSFDPNTMQMYSNGDTKYVDGILKINITDTTTKKTMMDKTWRLKSDISYDSSTNKYQSLVGELPVALPAGVYKCLLSGSDEKDTTIKKEYTDYITIKPFIHDKIALSDIQLSSKIIQDSQNKKSIFYKNTYEVVPLPNTLFSENTPALFYYCELYNLKTVKSSNPIKFSVFLYDGKRQLKTYKSSIISPAVDSRVEVGVIPINKYPTDTYTMIVTLIDSVDNYGVSSTKKFFIYNPSIVVKDTVNTLTGGSLSSEFAVMSEEELDNLFQESKYIATSKEIEQYKKLNNVKGKREFLYNFWKLRDTNPATPENEYYKEYLKRIKIANEKYSTIQKKGWLTDRGRIYLIYGEPSEIERFPNQVDSKPYEIWHYNEIQGGVEFDFGDLTGFSDYILLNSTARGEVQDTNWQSKIALQ